VPVLLFSSMLLPLMGFILGCVIFSILGRVVLALVPSFRFSIANLMFFVLGAFLGTVPLVIAYGWILLIQTMNSLALGPSSVCLP
jgi:hypothetical protein